MATPPRRLTYPCATGDHARCHGTVYVYPVPPGSTERFTRCMCRACNHKIQGTFEGK